MTAAMAPWRVGLIVAAALFVVFLLAKMRPRLEKRIVRRLRRMPHSSQRRIRNWLDRQLSDRQLSDRQPSERGTDD
jgi:hypothetical protein